LVDHALKGYPDAIADYNQVIQLDSNDAIALYWRGRARQRIGDETGGDDDIAAAKRIDPQVGNQESR
jgi:tetratricopeptide (TPR) repeat protein